MTIELLEINKAEKTKVPRIRTIHLEISDDTTIRLTEKYKEDKDFLTKAFSVGLIAMDTAGNNAENVELHHLCLLLILINHCLQSDKTLR